MGGSSSKVGTGFSEPSKSYNAGQVVEGNVFVEHSKPVRIKRISVQLIGTGDVNWSEQEYYTENISRINENGETVTEPVNRAQTRYFTSEKTYIRKIQYLAGDGSNSFILEAGTIFYPFRFKLPENLPSSFNSKHGSVSYLLRVKIKRPFRSTHIWRFYFTVNGVFDLNLEPRAVISSEMEKIDGVNFCVCKNGPISFILRMPQKSGFVPGEILDHYVEICNDSNKRIVAIKTILIQRLTFYAEGKEKEEKKAIATVKGHEIEKMEHKVWSSKELKIPSVLPTGLGGNCEIIDVDYSLRLEMRLSGSVKLIAGELPVWIGTIPLETFKK